jgi:type III secretory pathway lipoprotein EscJ
MTSIVPMLCSKARLEGGVGRIVPLRVACMIIKKNYNMTRNISRIKNFVQDSSPSFSMVLCCVVREERHQNANDKKDR